MSALLLLRPTTCRKHNLKKEQVSFATEMAEDICKLLKDYALWLAGALTALAPCCCRSSEHSLNLDSACSKAEKRKGCQEEGAGGGGRIGPSQNVRSTWWGGVCEGSGERKRGWIGREETYMKEHPKHDPKMCNFRVPGAENKLGAQFYILLSLATITIQVHIH